MISALNRLASGTIELTITIPWQRVKIAYEKTLAASAKKTEIKGFRKGKAPQKLVEEKLGKPAVYEKVLQSLVPEVYLEAVKEQEVKPILNPQIKVISLKEGKAWQVKAITCELPEIKLGDYQGEVKKALAAEKIWVPGKGAKNPAQTDEQKLAKIFKALLEAVGVNIPSILIEDEVNRMLSRLVDQTGRLGLTIDQYLVSAGKTSDQLKEEYRRQAEKTLKLEFILSAIANQEKITVTEAAIEKMIEVTPDEKTKKALDTPQQKIYLRQLLRKRQVIDGLMKL